MLNLERLTHIAHWVPNEATDTCTSYPDMGCTTRCCEFDINTAVNSFYYSVRQQFVLSSTTDEPCGLLRVRVRLASVNLQYAGMQSDQVRELKQLQEENDGSRSWLPS